MNPEPVRIVVEGPDSFSEHGRIPIVFTVSGRVDLAVLVETHGATVVERACPPSVKDYDLEETERPSRYVEHFDVTDWHLVSAFSGKERVGGAVVAVRALDFRISEGRPDTAVIVDLRIAPPVSYTHLNTTGLTRKTELFNYQTGLYEIIDQSSAQTSDKVNLFVASGSLTRFVEQGTGQVKVKTSYSATGPVSIAAFRARFDRVVVLAI